MPHIPHLVIQDSFRHVLNLKLNGWKCMTSQEHWEQAYSSNSLQQLGWYSPRVNTSLNWITSLDLSQDANIIDAGGGACTLVDDLLNYGYKSITVADLSRKALALAQERLADRAESVTWIQGDITLISLVESQYDAWHDRAVFHFLTDPEQRQHYRYNLMKALKPDGHLIIAVFAPEAPPRCSGLPVERYTLEKLKSTLGAEFELKQHTKELHITPGGTEQMYLYCHFQKSK
jgi:2-polyprenyl-3-methyl-5-hydroxy-6-metoxy-1,4-benzoquinol methylase